MVAAGRRMRAAEAQGSLLPRGVDCEDAAGSTGAAVGGAVVGAVVGPSLVAAGSGDGLAEVCVRAVGACPIGAGVTT